MALTELQLPTKTDLYTVIQNTAGEISSMMHRWGQIADFVNNMGATDMSTLGVPAEVQTDMANLRILLNEFAALWNNENVTPTNDPQEVVDALRKINHG